MNKVKLGAQALLYPAPVVLVGANVDDKPNLMAVAWCGIAGSDPPMISVSLRYNRHTFKGIRQNMTYSVNIPSVSLVKETDYCGIIHGSRADKVKVCQFNIFYGKLGSAPLVEQCPINLECKVAHMLELGSHVLIVGRIEEVYASEDCLTRGKPDVRKIKPFSYTWGVSSRYMALGKTVAKAFSAGQELKDRK
jgi:flavin reductase (DIM6/NTAB) family NADH-FMN oxidoreductase RutF